MKKIIIIVFVIILFWPFTSRAFTIEGNYPRLANYFLRWEISDSEAEELAKWDLLILDMENQNNSRDQILKIRALNPKIIILAYITSQEILDDVNQYDKAYLRQDLNEHIYDGWWLRDSFNHKVSNWPNTSMLNLSDGALKNSQGERFNDYLPEFVVQKLQSSGLWDGVFYDNTWGDISWLKTKNLDLNNDTRPDSREEADRLWSEGFKKMLAKTRSLAGQNFIIVGNGRIYQPYQKLINGMMLEDFPSPWENGGSWSGSMKSYLKLKKSNFKPAISIINIYNKKQNNYQRMRYGLVSTLLGDGFYSYDYDVSNHGQIWWYDEYSQNLGPAQSSAYNLLSHSSDIRPGLWRRDFKNALALVNSTNKKQVYVFKKEELERIKGTQDKEVNNGKKINYISLAPKDAVILLKRNIVIKNQAFTNGYFFRVFNSQGQQTRNGFFSYLKAFPGESSLVVASGSKDDKTDIDISAHNGKVDLYHDGRKVLSFKPYDNLYRKKLSIATQLDDGYFKRIVVGPGLGGGPQVRVFKANGKLESSFFAYNKYLRGGVNVALGDVDGDGDLEIVTGPGPGEKPLIKIFSLAGNLKNSFLAYGSSFHGGVNVAIGDINGDGKNDIITAPKKGGGPQVRIFNNQGKVLGSFFAYDKKYHGGIEVSVNDINSDGREEILVGLKNFY